MPTVQQQREKLIGLLKQLFQLDQPELDFGFYRIMHAKAKEVTRFLEDDLLKAMADAFGEFSGQQVEERLESARQRVVEQLGSTALLEDGTLADLFKETPAGKEYASALESARTATDTTTAEREVYDHLYRFFERYYEGGDFISKRYLTRETSGRAAPYAVPYNGEEVKLHWANSDQYYIKTTEYFTNFTFKLRPENAENPLPVTFRIVDATEGEHGNVKASNGQKRYFILHSGDPVGVEDGELVVRFEYRPDPEKTGQDNVWQGKRNEEAEKAVLAALEGVEEAWEYFEALRQPAPINTQRDRTLLGKFVARYSARNTMDYFIHKNLRDFLRRELDYYIKNEVMRLDDIESADAPRVEQYLNKIKVLRKIAGKLIDFLAQLEDFQKKLWLKKKFVVDTQYCITLSQVPEEFYPEIIANDAQREEWVRLFTIDEIKQDLTQPGYTVPLKPEFLKAHPTLVLDTRHFASDFTAQLLEAIGDLEDRTDGVLFHSENFQALNFLRTRYAKSIDCIYADPPYNTSATEIIYKNSYKHSSWLSLMADRISLAYGLLARGGGLCVTIDDFEFHRLRSLLEDICSAESIMGVAAIKNNPSGRATAKGFSIAHEYAVFVGKGEESEIGRLTHSEEQRSRYKEIDSDGQFEWVNFRKHGGANANRIARPKLFYGIFVSETAIRIPQQAWNETLRHWEILEEPNEDEVLVYPVTPGGDEKTWKWGIDTSRENLCELRPGRDQSGRLAVYRKARFNDEGTLPRTLWDKKEYSSTEYGTNLLARIFGEKEVFSFPKSVHAVSDCLRVAHSHEDSTNLDFFAGSGTTGHSIIEMNRADGGSRRFVLVEMGGHLNDALLPRLKKVTFTPEWKDGKPKRLATAEETERSPRIMKVIRLESYEDTLNNLEFKDDEARLRLLERSDELREDHTLHYMLDVETKGSQSLLNIDAFADPTAYKLKVKKPGSDEYDVRSVDLLETFNYLIGLRVEHISAPQVFAAAFKREPDPELPADSNTKLIVDGRIKQDANGPWWFRKVEGWTTDGNGGREKALIVWRKLTGDIEQDNLMLDEWFKANCISTQDFEYDTIYVNGSNNLPNLKREQDNWKVRLIEEDFFRLMWDVEDV